MNMYPENVKNGMLLSDTIAAIATPRGAGAIGIVRISGPAALALIDRLFTPYSGVIRPRQMEYGELRSPNGDLIDICMAALFKAPASYTGEDCAELYCHGGPAVLVSALHALFKAGARQAAPGEFTRRAFLNGKLDLFGAEAVADLVSAETETAAKNAAAQLRGAVGADIRGARDALVALAAHIYAEVDFPEEGVPPLVSDDIKKQLADVLETLSRASASFKRGSIIKNGVPIAIIGPPNAGKSSLLNALVGSDRAIVTSIPGTTRDVVEERFTYGGALFRLLDTAGLRGSDDPAERAGISRALLAAKDAAAVLLVSDGLLPGNTEIPAEASGKPIVRVRNKCDLPDFIPMDGALSVSALSGQGLEELCSALLDAIGGAPDTGTAITNERQAEVLSRASASVAAALQAADAGMTFDILACETEAAINALGEITGDTASEDIINGIFSRFCVGK